MDMFDTPTVETPAINEEANLSFVAKRIAAIRLHLALAGFQPDPEGPMWSSFSQWADAPSAPFGK